MGFIIGHALINLGYISYTIYLYLELGSSTPKPLPQNLLNRENEALAKDGDTNFQENLAV